MHATTKENAIKKTIKHLEKHNPPLGIPSLSRVATRGLELSIP